MAGLYIRNVKLPESAFDTLYLAVHKDGLVEYDGGPYGWQNTRAIPVPDHGRLVDADALADRLEKDRTFILHAMMEAHKKSKGHTREDYLFDRNGDMISMLRNQAAVIPAEKKEEK